MATTMTTKRLPAVLTGHALQSLRDSGFSLPAALGEPVDNSLEANANFIWVQLDEERNKRGKKQIHRIIIADDGEGMSEDVLHHYLQVGFSTRYMSKKTIGKYGVGAKLAALNFGKRIDVWSRTSEKEPWRHVYFDLDEAMQQEEAGEEVWLEPPTETLVPPDLAQYFPERSGTVVVWSKVERLEEGRYAENANELRLEVEKELSRIFRKFLGGGIKIRVNDTDLLPHDPLFLMEGTWADQVLTQELARIGKEGQADGKDKKPAPDLKHFPVEVIGKEEIKIGTVTAKLTITLYPEKVTRKRGQGGDPLAKKLRVPDNEGAISFMRLGREISYTNVPKIFPRGVTDPDRFIGIEVAFTPELDEYFGVRNVKRGVEPHDELRAQIRTLLKKHVQTARDRLEERWGLAAREASEHEGEHASIVDAVAQANLTLPKARAKGPEDEVERRRILEDLAKDVGKTDERAKQEYLDRIRKLPFVVESVDFPGSNFIDVQHVNGQVLIRLNTRHRFYRDMWEPIKEISERSPGAVSGEEAVRIAQRTREALTLLVIAYGKAESMHENPRDQYGDLRMYWGQFLDSLMGKVKDVI